MISASEPSTRNAAQTRKHMRMSRLLSIPGIGALNSTALVAAIGHASAFARGRDLAAWLGLVPRQATTGGKPRLLGITKRGNKYLRKMLIQGARSALPVLSKNPSRIGEGYEASYRGRTQTQSLWLWLCFTSPHSRQQLYGSEPCNSFFKSIRFLLTHERSLSRALMHQ
ncbi:MAG: IS110 family transposase [Hyphomicrobiales bacterium]|nr:MAG: IS110 family transposase [Hyphomicrobiales bacterium]